MIHVDASALVRLRDLIQSRVKDLDPNRLAESTAKKYAQRMTKSVRQNVERGLKEAATTDNEKELADKMVKGTKVRHRRVKSENEFVVEQPLYLDPVELEEIKDLDFKEIEATLGEDILRWVIAEKERRDDDVIKSGKSRSKFKIGADGEKIYANKRVMEPKQIAARVMRTMSFKPEPWLRMHGRTPRSGGQSLVDYLMENNMQGFATVTKLPLGVEPERAKKLSQVSIEKAVQQIEADLITPVMREVAEVLEKMFGRPSS